MKIMNSTHWKTALRAVFGTVALVGIIANSDAARKPAWDTSAALGFSLTQGNSETTLVNANIGSKGSYKNYAISLGADATFGEQNNVRNAETYRAFVQYDRKLTERFYVYGRVGYFHDGIADIEYRYKLNPGFGWHLINNDKWTLDIEAGPGYVFQEVGGLSDSFLSLRVGEKLTYKISDRARFWQSAEWTPEVSKFDNYFLTLQLGIEADITKKAKLRVVVFDDYNSQPAAGRKANDIKLVTGISYSFN
jgi:putative salt-induced outer membrane protein YdiY